METKAKAIHYVMSQRYNMSYLRKFTRHEAQQKLNSYFKFMVVRHPLDRLASAYKDKLKLNEVHFLHTLGQNILRMMRPNESEEVYKSGRGVTFEEYLTYLTKKNIPGNHFRNYQDICHPCVIKYDFIAKLETHDEDANFIINNHLSGIGAEKTLSRNYSRPRAREIKHVEEYDNITHQMLHDVAAVFSKDMNMFGYSNKKQDKGVMALCGDRDVADCC